MGVNSNPFKKNIKSYMSIGCVEKYLDIAYNLKINLALCGAHGRAKTSVIKQYADKNGFELITIILSRLTPEDMIGLPTTKIYNGEKVTVFSNPDWLVKASDKNKKVLLFFDEFTNAEVDTQASILDLIESREANGLTLNESTQIVMAYNPPSIAPNGRRLSKATRDRICVIPILDQPSKTSYMKYYRQNGMDVIANILNDTDDIISDYDDDVSAEAYDGAEFTYRSLEKSYNIVKFCIDNNIEQGISATMVCGYAGEIGKSISKRIFDDIEKEKNNGDITSLYSNAYLSGGVTNVIKEFRKNKNVINGGIETIKFHLDNIKTIVNPIEFQKILNECVTPEFMKAYNSQNIQL